MNHVEIAAHHFHDHVRIGIVGVERVDPLAQIRPLILQLGNPRLTFGQRLGGIAPRENPARPGDRG